VAESGAPEAALALVDGLETALPASHLVPAVRAELFARLHRTVEATAAFTEALGKVRTDAERAHLRRRLADLDPDLEPGSDPPQDPFTR
jgi:RNA polymerase sigma-70 factor (ECF subfamily)